MMTMLMLMIACLEAATICLRKNLSLVVMHRMMNILSLIMIFILIFLLVMMMLIVIMTMAMMFANPIYTESVCLLSPGGGIRQPVGTHSLADKNIINIIIIISINIIVIINIIGIDMKIFIK